MKCDPSLLRPAKPAVKSRLIRQLLLPPLIILLMVGLGLAGYLISESNGIRTLSENGERQLELHARTVESEISKYTYLPSLLELESSVSKLLAEPNQETRKAVNDYLEGLNRRSRSRAIYVMDTTGRVLATSNWRDADSYQGEDLSFRAYFQNAVRGQPGRFYGIGSTNGEPGYYLAHGLEEQGKIIGVAVVKVRLEAMEERQVSIDGVTRPLPNPFIVIATQNPVEHDGTYKLPESQLDRFLIRMEIGYPSRQAELDILEPKTGAELVDQLSPVVTTRDIQDMIAAATQVSMVEPLKNYLVDIAHTSRKHPQVALGLSPRAMIQLARAVRALAAARGRNYSTPDDVKELAIPVLAHRLVLRNNNSGLRLTNSDVIQEILASVPVPSGR